MRAVASLLLLALLGLAGVARAEEDRGPRIAWFHDLGAARKAAEAAGRPLFVALHVRPAVATPGAAERLERWVEVYRDPALVDLSRRFACVLRVVQAPEGDSAASGG